MQKVQLLVLRFFLVMSIPGKEFLLLPFVRYAFSYIVIVVN
jgi:hypothetical protein